MKTNSITIFFVTRVQGNQYSGEKSKVRLSIGRWVNEASAGLPKDSPHHSHQSLIKRHLEDHQGES